MPVKSGETTHSCHTRADSQRLLVELPVWIRSGLPRIDDCSSVLCLEWRPGSAPIMHYSI